MAIKLKLEGFDDLLSKIEKAGGSIDRATETCLKQSATIMQTELKSEMQKSNVPTDLVNAMPANEITRNGNRFTARVGYRKGSYNPNNLSDGYKVVFLNYGTPKRTKHGKITARGFIQRAKKTANTKIKKQQEATLKSILRELE